MQSVRTVANLLTGSIATGLRDWSAQQEGRAAPRVVRHWWLTNQWERRESEAILGIPHPTDSLSIVFVMD